jgi:hypothetical protein
MKQITFMTRGLAFLVAVLLVQACSDSSPTTPDPPEAVNFAGALQGEGEYATLEGTATLEASEDGFEIALTLDSAPEVDENGFPWILRSGSCAEPGDAFGSLADYPGIVLDAEGSWEGSVHLGISDEDTLILEVRRSESESETRIACGELERDES